MKFENWAKALPGLDCIIPRPEGRGNCCFGRYANLSAISEKPFIKRAGHPGYESGSDRFFIKG